MKEPALIIIKPDGVSKGLIGDILKKFDQAKLEIVAMRISKTSKELAEKHYFHIKGKAFFDGTIAYMVGSFHKQRKLVAIIYYGKDAIRKCRKIAGATNPEKADPNSIRGSYGRITTKGIYENVVHVSSTKREAKREIELWFKPSDLTIKNLYPSHIIQKKLFKERVWK